MFDAVSFGKRVQERRKAQGLTQEQLGAELGVTNQSVSKWENGESVPDLSLIPSICKVLGTTSDFLLDIDGGIGIESMSKELAKKIGDIKPPAQVDTLMLALMRFVPLGRPEDNSPWVPGNLMAFNHKSGQTPELRLWRRNRMACFIKGDILQNTKPTEESIGQVRTLVSGNCWEVACLLLTGPKKEKELVEASIGSAGDTKQALADMVESGLITLDKEGYRLYEYSGLPWATIIAAMASETRKQPTSLYVSHIP